MKPVANRAELFELHDQLCRECRDIMVSKNHDYAGGKDDPFSNFQASKYLGVEPEIGLMMRVMDKLKRVEAFVNTGNLKVKEESVFDAVRDVMNYMVLLGGLLTIRMAEQDGEVSCACADVTSTVDPPVTHTYRTSEDRIETPVPGSIYDQTFKDPRVGKHGHNERPHFRRTAVQCDVKLPSYDMSEFKEGPRD